MLASEKRRDPFQNLILSALPREEYARLRPSLEAVQLKQGKLLYGVGGQIRHAYFLAGGMASLVAVTEGGASVEVGMIGNEGVVGLPSVLGINSSVYGVVMQLPCNALPRRLSPRKKFRLKNFSAYVENSTNRPPGRLLSSRPFRTWPKGHPDDSRKSRACAVF